MKKILVTLAILLFFTSLAFARPVKEICAELGEVNDQGVFVGCSSVDSAELVVLKLLFNEINQELLQVLANQRDYTDDSVNVHTESSDREIGRLESVRDSLSNSKARARVQAKIDRVIAWRDFHSKTTPMEDGTDSPRTAAGKLGPIVSSLNQQLNNVQQEINKQ